MPLQREIKFWAILLKTAITVALASRKCNHVVLIVLASNVFSHEIDWAVWKCHNIEMSLSLKNFGKAQSFLVVMSLQNQIRLLLLLFLKY